MASKDADGTSANLTNRENVIQGKGKVYNAQSSNLLRRRPALGDVSNKITNQVTRDLKLTTLKAGDNKDSSKNAKIATNARKIQTKLLETRQIPPKLTKREESVIHSLHSFSSKQLNIYDPDENSKKDPTAVTDYVEDIFCHLREMEEKYAIEVEHLKDHQATPSMRAVLVNWMADLQTNFKLCIETLHLGVSITDRYLQTNKTVGRDTLQLVGATALMVAAKYEEVYTPEISDYVYVCDDTFSASQFLAMERAILCSLDFGLGRPSSIHFLRRYSKIAKVTSLQHNLGKYLLELAMLDYSLCHVAPSHQAAAACCLSVGILNEEMDLSKVWSPTLVHYTTYTLSAFRHVVVSLACSLVKIEKSKHQAIVQKYASSSFGKISTNAKLKGLLVMKLVAEVPAKKRQLTDNKY